ncbi:MAG: thiamine phosphate synthase [Dehalococcoidia bacterium]|nr:thiamine phosphate synthase [Dehalococcoidia bacterium]
MLRLLDANLDRLGEGLRVLEDISRFVLNDAALSVRLKKLRHSLVKNLGPLERELLSARLVAEDVGAPTRRRIPSRHQDLPALVAANSRRVQESLRVLEEFGRLSVGPVTGKAGLFEKARFEVYDLEQQVVGRLLRRDKAARLRGLYLVFDAAALGGRDEVSVAAAAARGGVKTIQLRDKRRSKADVLASARRLRPLCSEAGVLFIVNDHVDVALAVRADGVHLGQDDLPLAEARRILPLDMLIGCSSHSVAEAVRAQASGADYVAMGSIFPTTSKEKYKLVGLEALRRARPKLSVSLIAIGGINPSNIRAVMKTGVDGVAVISAIMGSSDVEKAARKLAAKMKGF